MDYEKDKSTKSSTKQISSGSKIDINKNQQKDSTPTLPQQQNQMDSKQSKSKTSSKKEKSTKNGSKMVLMKEEKDPFDNDVRPIFPTLRADIKNQQEDKPKNPAVNDIIRPIFPEGKFSTPMQQPKDDDIQQEQTDSKTPIFQIAEMDKKNGSHHEKSNVLLTTQQQCPKKQEQQVQLTPEQQQMKEEQQKLDRESLRMGQHQPLQQLEQQRLVQQERDSIKQQPTVNDTKSIKNLETAPEYHCCCFHVKTGTHFITVLHFSIIFALLIVGLMLPSDLKHLKGIEIAGFVLLGCSFLTVSALLIGICLENVTFLFGYVSCGVLECVGIIFYVIFLCVHFDGLTYEQLGITPSWARFLTVCISFLIMKLQIICCYIVYQCMVYYDENQS